MFFVKVCFKVKVTGGQPLSGQIFGLRYLKAAAAARRGWTGGTAKMECPQYVLCCTVQDPTYTRVLGWSLFKAVHSDC